MKVLNEEEILCVWEQGLHLPLLQRILILLVAAYPEQETDSLAKLSIGQRDTRLFELREQLFGQQLFNTSLCPKCEKRVEWESKTSDFIEPTEPSKTIKTEFDVNIGDYLIRLRLPNSLDIAAVINDNSDSNSRNPDQHLLSRCLLNVEHAQINCDPALLPQSTLEKVSQHIERLDPCADIRINLNCPECSHRWDALFDIASFLWAEVNDWAERTLLKVHKLASAYGWSEREILNLSPLRRQLYLGMVGS